MVVENKHPGNRIMVVCFNEIAPLKGWKKPFLLSDKIASLRGFKENLKK